MPFAFQTGWDTRANNNGATRAQITAVCHTANGPGGSGDAGLRNELTNGTAQISVVKGIHQDTARRFPHITVDYLGGRWHVGLVTTAAGGAAGYRVGVCTQ